MEFIIERGIKWIIIKVALRNEQTTSQNQRIKSHKTERRTIERGRTANRTK